MKEELTYILGAGASYESIPIVKTFPNRFQKFVHYISNIKESQSLKEPDINATKQCSQIFLNEIINHQSFDTYFKKLYHTGQTEKIINGKKILNIYFTWEHCQKDIVNDTKKDEGKFYKKATVDKRYDALIASLLKPISGEKSTYKKVNFITWNYDLNLISSIKNYFFPDLKWKEFKEKIQLNNPKNVWNIDNQIEIVNMNGFFYSSVFDESIKIYDVNFDMIIGNCISKNFSSNNELKDDFESIQFAWENSINEDVILIQNIAKSKVINSSNIVVIGYSFPLYNRLVDLTFFNAQNLDRKKLFIQDLEADEITSNVLENFNIQIESMFKGDFTTTIKPINNCNNFYVPKDIFKAK